MLEISSIGIFAAFLAGAISFLSPCVLPLVPGYVSYIAGQPDLAAGRAAGLRARLAVGTLAAIGTELVRIDGVSATSLTVGRGCLDTVPHVHAAGTPVICWQQLGNATEPRFAAGETVTAKLLPETGFGTLPLAQAPADQVMMASRAIRPLPPGDLRAGGLSVVNPNVLNQGPVPLTWAHRDRLAQTSPVFDAYTAGHIGPEPGVGYWVEIRWVDPITDQALEPPAAELDAGTGTAFTLTKDHVPLLQAPTGTKHLDVRVQARRAAGSSVYAAWQARSIRLFMPDGIKFAEASAWVESGGAARLTVALGAVLVEPGSRERLTVAAVAVWTAHGGAAALSVSGAELFLETGGGGRLTAALACLYIEVIP